jgi:hypothetical protein
MRRKVAEMRKWNHYIKLGELGDRKMRREKIDAAKDEKLEREAILILWYAFKKRVVEEWQHRQMELLYRLSLLQNTRQRIVIEESLPFNMQTSALHDMTDLVYELLLSTRIANYYHQRLQ